ncbi:MAG: serine/threonine-protein phosphatase [Rhizobacter sp.]|nr:serine/threonine-protein phosphatase [Chlorobiales bacterium]
MASNSKWRPNWRWLPKSVTRPLEQYEFFFALPERMRMFAALAAFIFALAIGMLLHLMLRSVATVAMLFWMYAYTVSVGLLGFAVILFPPVRKYYSLLLGLVIAAFIVIMNTISMSKVRGSASLDFEAVGLTFAVLVLLSVAVRFYSKVIREVSDAKSRVDTEIKLAQKIQAQLLPVIDGNFGKREKQIQVFGISVPATEVGGDYFDVVQISDTKTAIAIGDVAGHNVAAGVMMAIVKTAFRSELRHFSTAEALMSNLNQTVYASGNRQMFTSFLFGVFDSGERSFTFSNAGHLPPVHLASGRLTELIQKSLAFGLREDAAFRSQKIYFNTHDLFFFATDGLTEAASPSGDEFGFAELHHFCNTHAALAPKEFCVTLQDDIHRFTQTTLQRDDLTLLAIKIL